MQVLLDEINLFAGFQGEEGIAMCHRAGKLASCGPLSEVQLPEIMGGKAELVEEFYRMRADPKSYEVGKQASATNW